MYEAPGDARNTTAPAISQGSPQRPIAVLLFSHSLTSGLATTAALVAVAKKTGATALTVIAFDASSADSALVRASSPPLAAVYTASPARASGPATDVTLMMRPYPCICMSCAALRDSSNGE